MPMREAMMGVASIAAGGALGALARHGVSVLAARAFPAPVVPWGTLAVNTIGCFAMGCAMGVLIDRQGPGADPLRLLIVTGFLGGLTTFSAFGHDTADLLRQGEAGRAVLNIALNVVLSLAAVMLGWWIVRRGA